VVLPTVVLTMVVPSMRVSLFVVLVERKSCCGTANGDIAGGGTATGGAGRGTAG